MMPASTSPEPDVASPTLPPSCCHRSPPGAAITVRAPFSATTAFQSCAASTAWRSGAAPISSFAMPVRCAISPACGVSRTGTLKRKGGLPVGGCSTAPIASASSNTFVSVPSRRGSNACTRRAVAASSCMPGPIRMALILSASGSSAATASTVKPPASFSASPSTRDSGIASATSWATLRPVAMVSLPAPARRAAVAARITAPGISREPPRTSTWPRSSLSASFEGMGTGQLRSRLVSTSRGRALVCSVMGKGPQALAAVG